MQGQERCFSLSLWHTYVLMTHSHTRDYRRAQMNDIIKGKHLTSRLHKHPSIITTFHLVKRRFPKSVKVWGSKVTLSVPHSQGISLRKDQEQERINLALRVVIIAWQEGNLVFSFVSSCPEVSPASALVYNYGRRSYH